ncbi:MAG: hypothetical protein ACOXZ4_07605 [Sphaerochaetaceae bacterium]
MPAIKLLRNGVDTLIMNTGMFLPFDGEVDITADQIVQEAARH